MKKFIFLLFILSFCLAQKVFAQESDRMLVSAVSVPTMQTSYGIYSNTTDMIANDLINALNRDAGYTVPDINTTKGLIDTYGLSKDYKKFLMNFRDNRIVDYEICNNISTKLGVSKILLVSGGYNFQDMVINKYDLGKYDRLPFLTIPVMAPLYISKLITHGMFFMQMPFIGLNFYDNFSDGDPIKPKYTLNVVLTYIDAATGIVLWEKPYSKYIDATTLAVPVNSLSENQLYSEQLRKFSKKISKETLIYMAKQEQISEYTSVKSAIVSDKKQNEKEEAAALENKETTDKKNVQNGNHDNIEENRKNSYKNWVKQQVSK